MAPPSRIKKKRKLFRGNTVSSSALRTVLPLHLSVRWSRNVGPSSLATYPICWSNNKGRHSTEVKHPHFLITLA